MIDVNVLRGASIRSPIGNRTGTILDVSLPWVKLGWDTSEGVLPKEESILRSDPYIDLEVEVKTLDRGWLPLGSVLGAKSDTPPAPETPVVEKKSAIKDLIADLRNVLADLSPAPVTEAQEEPQEAQEEAQEPSQESQEGFVPLVPGTRRYEALAEGSNDKAHSPYKMHKVGKGYGSYPKSIGHGPKSHPEKTGRQYKRRDVWDCHKGEQESGYYVQNCVATQEIPDQGIPKGYHKTIKIKMDYKLGPKKKGGGRDTSAGYNAQFKKYAKDRERVAFPVETAAKEAKKAEAAKKAAEKKAAEEKAAAKAKKAAELAKKAKAKAKAKKAEKAAGKAKPKAKPKMKKKPAAKKPEKKVAKKPAKKQEKQKKVAKKVVKKVAKKKGQKK